MEKKVSILFIGTSHTFVNDVPLTVKALALENEWTCRVGMIAHGGWFLGQHVKEPDVRFNILYGEYDYVVLQEHAQPFGPVESFREAAVTLTGWIHRAGAVPVLYGTWARKTEPEIQPYMNETHRAIAEETGSLLAPVGERWQSRRMSSPEAELYGEDGAHASPAGSAFAAEVIWETIRADLESRAK